ncbi:MAG: hypothetical protein CSA15_05940 [Candidatus Delongbacteria bacterium]|nr:MAG: hypothetical protein CSA15_05940 [Candidatus Delongbacteria bacterium]
MKNLILSIKDFHIKKNFILDSKRNIIANLVFIIFLLINGSISSPDKNINLPSIGEGDIPVFLPLILIIILISLFKIKPLFLKTSLIDIISFKSIDKYIKNYIIDILIIKSLWKSLWFVLISTILFGFNPKHTLIIHFISTVINFSTLANFYYKIKNIKIFRPFLLYFIITPLIGLIIYLVDFNISEPLKKDYLIFISFQEVFPIISYIGVLVAIYIYGFYYFIQLKKIKPSKICEIVTDNSTLISNIFKRDINFRILKKIFSSEGKYRKNSKEIKIKGVKANALHYKNLLESSKERFSPYLDGYGIFIFIFMITIAGAFYFIKPSNGNMPLIISNFSIFVVMLFKGSSKLSVDTHFMMIPSPIEIKFYKLIKHKLQLILIPFILADFIIWGMLKTDIKLVLIFTIFASIITLFNISLNFITARVLKISYKISIENRDGIQYSVIQMVFGLFIPLFIAFGVSKLLKILSIYFYITGYIRDIITSVSIGIYYLVPFILLSIFFDKILNYIDLD